jgi:hypothetical protein
MLLNVCSLVCTAEPSLAIVYQPTLVCTAEPSLAIVYQPTLRITARNRKSGT